MNLETKTVLICLTDESDIPLIVERPRLSGRKWKTTSTLAKEAKQAGANYTDEEVIDIFYKEHPSISALRAKTGLEYYEIDKIFNERGIDYDKELRKLRLEERGNISELKESALQRDGNKCAVCGDSDHLEMHHIDGVRSNNHISNLVILCEFHHDLITNGIPVLYALSDEDGYQKQLSSSLKQAIDTVEELRNRGFVDSHLEWVHFWNDEDDRILIRHEAVSKITMVAVENMDLPKLVVAIYSHMLDDKIMHDNPRFRRSAFEVRVNYDGMPVYIVEEGKESLEWFSNLKSIKWLQ